LQTAKSCFCCERYGFANSVQQNQNETRSHFNDKLYYYNYLALRLEHILCEAAFQKTGESKWIYYFHAFPLIQYCNLLNTYQNYTEC
jgi:hypothetical protein